MRPRHAGFLSVTQSNPTFRFPFAGRAAVRPFPGHSLLTPHQRDPPLAHLAPSPASRPPPPLPQLPVAGGAAVPVAQRDPGAGDAQHRDAQVRGAQAAQGAWGRRGAAAGRGRTGTRNTRGKCVRRQDIAETLVPARVEEAGSQAKAETTDREGEGGACGRTGLRVRQWRPWARSALHSRLCVRSGAGVLEGTTEELRDGGIQRTSNEEEEGLT